MRKGPESQECYTNNEKRESLINKIPPNFNRINCTEKKKKKKKKVDWLDKNLFPLLLSKVYLASHRLVCFVTGTIDSFGGEDYKRQRLNNTKQKNDKKIK